MLKEQILKARTKVIPLTVPEWGECHLRQLTLAERDSFVEFCRKKTSEKDVIPRLVVLTLCDVDGNRVFKDGEESLLHGQSAAVLDFVALAAKDLNTVEDAKKN